MLSATPKLYSIKDYSYIYRLQIDCDALDITVLTGVIAAAA